MTAQRQKPKPRARQGEVSIPPHVTSFLGARVAELEHERDAAKEGELQALLALTRTKADRDAWQARARSLATALAPFADRSCFYYESGPGECRSFCAERDETLCDTCEARAALDAAKG